MSRVNAKKLSAPITADVHIVIPAHLHKAMRTIRRQRHKMECSDLKLSRLYREAVEQYIQAAPQQRLLNGDPEALRNTA